MSYFCSVSVDWFELNNFNLILNADLELEKYQDTH